MSPQRLGLSLSYPELVPFEGAKLDEWLFPFSCPGAVGSECQA